MTVTRPSAADRRLALAWWRVAFAVDDGTDRRILRQRRARDPAVLAAWLAVHRMRSPAAVGARRSGHPDLAWLDPGATTASGQRLALIADALAAQRALDRAGIAHVFLKGPIAAAAYARSELRDPSADIDLAVPPARVEDAVWALEEAGWHGYYDRRLLEWARHHFFAWDLMPGPERRMPLDLHWRYDARGREEASALEGIFENVEEMVCGGQGLPVPAASRRLDLLLAHGSRSAWERWRLIADVAAWLHRHGSDALAVPVGRGRRLGLLLAHRALRAPLSPALLRALAADCRARRLAPAHRRARLAWTRPGRWPLAVDRLESIRWQRGGRARLSAMLGCTLRDVAGLPPALRGGIWPLLMRIPRLLAQRLGLLAYD